jgi:hypothetical protein
MPPTDPLARQILKDAFELHRRKLWMRGAQEAPILIHAPAEEHSVVATLAGRAGRDFGVNLMFGEEAFVQAVRWQYTDRRPDHERVPTLICSLDRLADIPMEFRRVLDDAGFRGRRESLAPWILVAAGPGPARPPRERELRALGWCLRALLLTDDAGALDPPELDLDDRRVLSIEVAGRNPRAARAEASQIPWPHDVPELEARPPAAPVEDPRTLEEWKAAEEAFVQRFVTDTIERKLWNRRSLAAYFGSHARAEKVMHELEDLGPQIAFSEWLIADYRPTHRSRTWVEKLQESARETPAERELARARVEAELQVVRVVARDAGRWLEVEDLVGGARNRLWDTQLSSSCPDEVIFPVRLLRIGEWIFPTLAGPALTSFTVDRVLGSSRCSAGSVPSGARRASARSSPSGCRTRRTPAARTPCALAGAGIGRRYHIR